jgi:hypothetical protein
MTLRTWTYGAFGAAALVAFTGAATAGTLDGGSIKRLFPGRFEAKVQGYTVYFAGFGNGTLKGQAYGRQDKGVWFVKGNTLCVAFRDWTKGKAKCGQITQQGGWFVANNTEGEVLKFRRSLVAQQ